MDVRRSGNAYCARRLDRLLHPRPPRRTRRSHDRPALRIEFSLQLFIGYAHQELAVSSTTMQARRLYNGSDFKVEAK